MRFALPPLLAIALFGPPLAGCRSLLDKNDKAECVFDGECPEGERCDETLGRCLVSEARAVADVSPLDPNLSRSDRPNASIPDAPGVVDAAVDLPSPDAMPPDASVDPPFGPDGECFSLDRGLLSTTQGSNLPRGFCTPFGLVWSEPRGNGQVTLLTQALGEARTLLVVPAETPFVVEDDIVLLSMANPDRDGFHNILRLSLREPETSPVVLQPRAGTQSQPVRATGRSAFVQHDTQAGVEHRSVVVHADDDTGTRCSVPGGHAWGPALTPGRVVFFSKVSALGSVDLVVARDKDCASRASIAIPSGVTDEAQVVADGQRLYWLADDAASRRRRIYTADADRLDRGTRLLSVQNGDTLSPLSLVARGDFLLVASFEQRRQTVRAFDIITGNERPLSVGGQALLPSLSSRYALWSERRGVSPWEIRYERLPSR
ncbi:MAG: hypothetical protein EXR76_18095 [Myxococcales bacterium]|nr:hypothetical protein [Myxococcales bacterium]